MRVALINDGTYPYRAGVSGTWTHRLVRGLPEHAFHFVTITDATPVGAVFYPPNNTLSMTSITLGGPGIGPTKRKAALQPSPRRDTRCRGALPQHARGHPGEPRDVPLGASAPGQRCERESPPAARRTARSGPLRRLEGRCDGAPRSLHPAPPGDARSTDTRRRAPGGQSDRAGATSTLDANCR